MMEFIFIYVIPSVATILAILLIIILGFLTPTGKLLLKKRLGLVKGSVGFTMVAWDDRVLQTEQMSVHPEGAMEKKRRKKGSLTFYLAKPQDDTANIEDNLKNEERDRDVLPPYYLDGVLPVYLAHVSKAVATNPKALAALRLANRVEPETPNRLLKRDVILEKRIEYMEDNGDKVATETMKVNVLLPFDPVDIKKNFPAYWQQANIDATKKRHQRIGAEKEKKSTGDVIKMMIIGAIVACFMIGGVVIAGRLFG